MRQEEKKTGSGLTELSEELERIVGSPPGDEPTASKTDALVLELRQQMTVHAGLILRLTTTQAQQGQDLAALQRIVGFASPSVSVAPHARRFSGKKSLQFALVALAGAAVEALRRWLEVGP